MSSKTFKRLPLITFVLAFSLYYQSGFSFSVVRNVSTQSNNNTSVDYLKASVFITLSAKDFEAVSGRKLNFFQKIYFKIFQNQVKRDLKKNPDFLITNYNKPGNPKSRFSFLWFVVGSIIGPIGVLLAYTDKEKKGTVPKKDRLLPVWLGFIFFIAWFGYIFIF